MIPIRAAMTFSGLGPKLVYYSQSHYVRVYNMVAKRVTTRKRVSEPPAPSTKSFPTAALGLGMVILTNYQAEVKQVLGFILKTLT